MQGQDSLHCQSFIGNHPTRSHVMVQLSDQSYQSARPRHLLHSPSKHKSQPHQSDAILTWASKQVLHCTLSNQRSILIIFYNSTSSPFSPLNTHFCRSCSSQYPRSPSNTFQGYRNVLEQKRQPNQPMRINIVQGVSLIFVLTQ